MALPYGTAVRARPHPREGTEKLRRHIGRFGRRNRHLAAGRCCGGSSNSSNSSNSSSHVVRAAWFVSHCDTASGREEVVKGTKSSHKLTAKLFSEMFLHKIPSPFLQPLSGMASWWTFSALAATTAAAGTSSGGQRGGTRRHRQSTTRSAWRGRRGSTGP